MQDADFVVATNAIERTVKALEAAGFQSERYGAVFLVLSFLKNPNKICLK